MKNLKLIGFATLSAIMAIACSDDSSDDSPKQSLNSGSGCHAPSIIQGMDFGMCVSSSEHIFTAEDCAFMGTYMSYEMSQKAGFPIIVNFSLQNCPLGYVLDCEDQEEDVIFYIYGTAAATMGFTSCSALFDDDYDEPGDAGACYVTNFMQPEIDIKMCVTPASNTECAMVKLEFPDASSTHMESCPPNGVVRYCPGNPDLYLYGSHANMLDCDDFED